MSKLPEAMSRIPTTVTMAPPVHIEQARLLAPPKPIKGGRVRVVQKPSTRRRWLYLASAASILVAGLAVGLYTVQSWRLEASESEKARLTRVSNTLAQKVSETQIAFQQMTSELAGQPVDPEAQTALAGVFDGEGKPLDEAMLDLAFRDLQMREQLGAVRAMLAKADSERTDEAKRNEILETQVAALQGHIEELRAEQSEVHQRLAGRIDSSIAALETALTATGVDFNSLIDPALGGTPLMVAGVDDQVPMAGVGGPFIAEGTKEYVNPVPGETEVMSGFGPRGHTHHNGIDIPAPIGTAVLAVTAGEIIHVQDREAWERRPKFVTIDGKRDRSKGWRAGIYVELRHDDLRISRYMHLSAIAPGITVGARVAKGQVLGSVGRTGVEVSETHLHFELREPAADGGRFGQALDPTAAVHADDLDLVVGTSLLHLDPAALDPSTLDPSTLDPETRKRLAAARQPAEAGGDANERLDGRMDRLQSLEKLLREMPLVAPVDDLRVSSPFGRRLDPIEGEWAFHAGIDVPGEEGTTIRATAPGTVSYSGDGGRYGVMVEIDHGNGITTRYGHLLRSLVRKGDRVKYREKIGEMGNSGRSTATHLHYEVRVDDKPRDPMNFIQAGRYVFKR
ncbi:MAG: peptidoglycan DD-metalloendopeptidase family protein [Myxococcales bacterium]|nr:peptidoglycan DD-metalloendopeptidase family protein [Myxococcales bacterium]